MPSRRAQVLIPPLLSAKLTLTRPSIARVRPLGRCLNIAHVRATAVTRRQTIVLSARTLFESSEHVWIVDKRQ